MKHLLTLGLAALVSACGGGGSGPVDTAGPPVGEPPLRVYIFAGQSNMLGADALIDPSGTLNFGHLGTQTAADKAGLFSMGGAFSQGWGDIRGHNSYHQGEPTIGGLPVQGHGPEVGFNRVYGGDIAIIKYSANYYAPEGGRSAWVKPGAVWRSWQTVIDQQLATLGKPYVIAGFVWVQGIDDALMGRSQAAYEADIRQVAADLRLRFGNKPFVLARSVDSEIATPVAMAPIRSAQVAVGSDPGNAWVSVDDLGPWVGVHHLTSAAQLELGKRLAEEMLALE